MITRIALACSLPEKMDTVTSPVSFEEKFWTETVTGNNLLGCSLISEADGDETTVHSTELTVTETGKTFKKLTKKVMILGPPIEYSVFWEQLRTTNLRGSKTGSVKRMAFVALDAFDLPIKESIFDIILNWTSEVLSKLGETKENEASVLKTCLRLGLTEISDVPLVDGSKKTMSMSLFWVTGM